MDESLDEELGGNADIEVNRHWDDQWVGQQWRLLKKPNPMNDSGYHADFPHPVASEEYVDKPFTAIDCEIVRCIRKAIEHTNEIAVRPPRIIGLGEQRPLTLMERIGNFCTDLRREIGYSSSIGKHTDWIKNQVCRPDIWLDVGCLSPNAHINITATRIENEIYDTERLKKWLECSMSEAYLTFAQEGDQALAVMSNALEKIKVTLLSMSEINNEATRVSNRLQEIAAIDEPLAYGRSYRG